MYNAVILWQSQFIQNNYNKHLIANQWGRGMGHASGSWASYEVSVASWSALRWRHNDHAGVSNHQPHGCLLNRLFRRKSKKTSKLRITGLCVGNSPGTGEFPAQMASYAENVSIWWRHHGLLGIQNVICFTFANCKCHSIGNVMLI